MIWVEKENEISNCDKINWKSGFMIKHNNMHVQTQQFRNHSAMSFSKHKTEKIWQEISKKSEKEQWHILEWKLQAREPIYEFSDIKPGDHLVKKISEVRGNLVLPSFFVH